MAFLMDYSPPWEQGGGWGDIVPPPAADYMMGPAREEELEKVRKAIEWARETPPGWTQVQVQSLPEIGNTIQDPLFNGLIDLAKRRGESGFSLHDALGSTMDVRISYPKSPGFL